MMNIFKYIKKYDLINNFPKNYPTHKKIIANIMFLFARSIITPRKNLLTKIDLKKAKKKLKKGDLVFVGTFKRASSIFIRGPLTHSLIYVGGNRFIHSRAEGVQYLPFYELFTEYDTLVILRLPEEVKRRSKIIKKAIYFAKKQIGKPYNFEFGINYKKKEIPKKFLCTELINYCYKKAGYDTGMNSFSKIKYGARIKIMGKRVQLSKALHPVEFVEKSDFKIIFTSHNLKIKDNKFYFKTGRSNYERIKSKYKQIMSNF